VSFECINSRSVVNEAFVCLPSWRRSDAAQWPGGGVAAYLARIQQEVLPWVAREYGASLNPNDLALAGSSFGGVAALAAGMSSGGQGGGCAFGALLVESPSMWIADEAFLKVGEETALPQDSTRKLARIHAIYWWALSWDALFGARSRNVSTGARTMVLLGRHPRAPVQGAASLVATACCGAVGVLHAVALWVR
jgi:hypothetical protein